MKKTSPGCKVVVYDRYRLAKPLRAVVIRKSRANDGVEVMLQESNNPRWPVGTTTWVHKQQLRRQVQLIDTNT